ncbi:MAG: LysM peptidoglycan-binding domain-containing protein [Cytophagales bacterium]|nr:MAG: LysM peptidoglycan-binding domain-containing protein [Cytophagales bacterium]
MENYLNKMIGEKILNYQVEKLLNQNALFTTYIAKHLQYNKKVLIKVLTSPALLESNTDKIQLVEEIKQLSQIQHPNIITFYDYLEQNDNLYLFFEYIEGHSLSQYIEEVSGPIPNDKARIWLMTIAETYQFAAQKNLFRYIHPELIYITKEGNLKFLESAFSHFYLKQAEKENPTKALSHISPEYKQGAIISAESDTFSLGLLLFQMLTGKSLENINTQSLPAMRSFYPAILEDLQTFVSKATNPDKTQRFSSYTAFKDALANIDLNKVVTLPEAKQFINVPLISLGIAAVMATTVVYNYNYPGKTSRSEVVFNLQDTSYINKKRDSIDKARNLWQKQDSVRIAKLQTKNKEKAKIYMHKVRPNETMESIAAKYYIAVDTVRALNEYLKKTRSNAKLEAKYGVKVKVRDVYSLRKDETIDQVAYKYNISKLILLQVNNIVSEKEDLFEGKNIVIPIVAGR